MRSTTCNPQLNGAYSLKRPFLTRGFFRVALALQGAIYYPIQPTLPRGWKGQKALIHQPVEHRLPWPTPTDQQTPPMPPPNLLGCIAAQGFTGGLLKTHPVRRYLEPKDQKMAVAEPSPQRLKKTLYFFGQPRYLDHGWPLGEPMKNVWLPLSTPKQASPQVSGRADRNYTALKIRNKLLSKSYQAVNFE